MRLYLSSYRLGNQPEQMVPLIKGAKKTAIIMNAKDNFLPEGRAERLQDEINNLTNLGLQPEELDLRAFFDKTDELEKYVKQFDYFWVVGGNVFLLRRAFRQSGFDHIISKLLQEDRVAYGGFSAGIAVLCPSLHGIELVDPKDEVSEGYNSEVIWDGLGLLDYAIAPHYKSPHPESADIEKCVEYFKENDMPYKTLRDGEAILVNGAESKVIG